MLCIGVSGAAGCLCFEGCLVESGRRVHPTWADQQRRNVDCPGVLSEQQFSLGALLLMLLFGALKEYCVHDCIACTQEQAARPQCVPGSAWVFGAVIVRGARYVTLGAADIVSHVKGSVCCAQPA